MHILATIPQLVVLLLLMISAMGVLYLQSPVHACLSFLLTLLLLSFQYVLLKAPFVAVMQVLIYAGAILVIFMFVIVLFQDAHSQIVNYRSKSRLWFLYLTAATFAATMLAAAWDFIAGPHAKSDLPQQFGSASSIGKALYVDFFFPFEAVALIFLVALVGALYIGKKETGSK